MSKGSGSTRSTNSHTAHIVTNSHKNIVENKIHSTIKKADDAFKELSDSINAMWEANENLNKEIENEIKTGKKSQKAAEYGKEYTDIEAYVKYQFGSTKRIIRSAAKSVGYKLPKDIRSYESLKKHYNAIKKYIKPIK